MSRVAALTTRCELDVRYGDRPAQRLDIYMPADTSLRDLPVFVNIHGGGWLIGYKEWCGLNAPALVDLPAIYVSVEYGLMPGTPHPGSLQDCLLAVGWIAQEHRALWRRSQTAPCRRPFGGRTIVGAGDAAA